MTMNANQKRRLEKLLERKDAEKKQRVSEARKEALEANSHSKGLSAVGGYTRVRYDNTETVTAHHKGMGPNKKVPNVPQKRLKEWLARHGATEGQVNAIYRVTLDEAGLKTHDLINRGLLDVDNYLQSLNK